MEYAPLIYGRVLTILLKRPIAENHGLLNKTIDFLIARVMQK